MSELILVLNCGSSSIKFALFDASARPLPRQPLCAQCPVQPLCVAHAQGTPERYPVKSRRLQRRAERWWLLLWRNPQGAWWLQRRPAPGIWAGLHCPPVCDSEAALAEVLAQLPASVAAQAQYLTPFVHVLTHRDLHLHPVLLSAPDTPAPVGAPQALPGHLDYALDVELKGGEHMSFGTTLAPEGKVLVRHLKRQHYLSKP